MRSPAALDRLTARTFALPITPRTRAVAAYIGNRTGTTSPTAPPRGRTSALRNSRPSGRRGRNRDGARRCSPRGLLGGVPFFGNLETDFLADRLGKCSQDAAVFHEDGLDPGEAFIGSPL